MVEEFIKKLNVSKDVAGTLKIYPFSKDVQEASHKADVELVMMYEHKPLPTKVTDVLESARQQAMTHKVECICSLCEDLGMLMDSGIWTTKTGRKES